MEAAEFLNYIATVKDAGPLYKTFEHFRHPDRIDEYTSSSLISPVNPEMVKDLPVSQRSLELILEMGEPFYLLELQMQLGFNNPPISLARFEAGWSANESVPYKSDVNFGHPIQQDSPLTEWVRKMANFFDDQSKKYAPPKASNLVSRVQPYDIHGFCIGSPKFVFLRA